MDTFKLVVEQCHADKRIDRFFCVVVVDKCFQSAHQANDVVRMLRRRINGFAGTVVFQHRPRLFAESGMVLFQLGLYRQNMIVSQHSVFLDKAEAAMQC